MKQIATVDRFEDGFVVLETDDGMVNIPLSNAPQMLGEGMVVEYEDGRIVRVDLEETERREDELRRRFERILGKND